MPQILPENPSFGQMFARNLGSGLSQGLGQASQFVSQMAMKKAEMQQRGKLAENIHKRHHGLSDSKTVMPQEELESKFLEALPQIEQAMGQELKPEHIDLLWNAALKNNQGQTSQGIQQNQDPYAEAEELASAGLHDESQIATQRAKGQEKRQLIKEEREFLPKSEYIKQSAKGNQTYIDKVHKIQDEIPDTDVSIKMMEDSLGGAGKWAAFRDMLAERTGFNGFRSAAGAELQSAIKKYFLSDLGSVKGGRPNVFIEKMLIDAYPKAGNDPISNQKIASGMRMKRDIDQLHVDTENQLEALYLKKQGYLPANFESLVKEKMKEKAIKIEKDTIKTLTNLNKISESRDKIFRSDLKPGESLMMSPDGEPFAVPKKELDAYKEQGYIQIGKK